MIESRPKAWYLCGAATLLLLWQGASVLADLPIVPRPIAVLVNLGQTFADKIVLHSLFSFWRIVAGALCAMVIGIPVGLCMGYFPRLDRALSPLVYLTYPIPKIALLPVVMLLSGLGETAKIIMIVMIIVFQVIIAVRDGVRSIPGEMYYPLYSLGAGFTAVLREILIPASTPRFLSALRIAMATAVSVLFFTETFGTEYGMGYFIMDAWMRVNYLEMYSGIVVLSVMGLIVFAIIDWLERRLCRWQTV
ncbi:MAG TPA: ABC transporter permease [Negativicutes bacterium]|nr:ABC transporter permease [Negativicutes bacterium]